MKFPTLVYKCPGHHSMPKGSYDYLAIVDEDQLKEALKNGWFLTLDEAKEGKATPTKKRAKKDPKDKIIENSILGHKEVKPHDVD